MDATLEIIREIIRETNAYLDEMQRAEQLWNEMESHLLTSYLAESLGDTALVSKHLQAVGQLLVEVKSPPSA